MLTTPPSQSSERQRYLRSISEQKFIIARLRRALSLFIITIGLALAIYLYGSEEEAPSLVEMEEDTSDIREYALKPHFRFNDRHDNYHVVSADWGRVSRDNKDEILLKDIIALYYQAGKTEEYATLYAKGGVLNRKEQLLTLLSQVSILTQDGYDVRTEKAYASISDRIVYGDEKVVIFHPQSRIEALGFRISDEGETIHFNGPATMTLHPAKTKSNEP